MKLTSCKQPTLLLTIVVFFWFAQYVYVPYQTPYLLMAHVSSNVVGTIIGAYGISQLVLRLPAGVLADLSSNHKLFILLGTFFSGIASLFRMILPDETGFFVGNILSGTASATWISFMILYMSFYRKDQQIQATSKIIMANNIGMLFGFITSTILYDFVGMKMICLFSLIAGLIGFGLSFSLESVKVSRSTKVNVVDLLKVATDKNLIIFSILALVQQGVQMSTTMSFTNQLITNLGASNLLVGISSIIYMISAVLFAKLASTKLLMLLSIKNWIYISFFALGLYCLLIPQANSVFLIYLLQIIPGMGTGILFSLLTSQALKNIDSQKRSTAMGFYQAVYAIGMTTLPIISGNLNETFSIQFAFWFLAGICFIAIFIAIVYFKISAKHKNKEPQVSSPKIYL